MRDITSFRSYDLNLKNKNNSLPSLTVPYLHVSVKNMQYLVFVFTLYSFVFGFFYDFQYLHCREAANMTNEE
jgi:hypothetical protein